ncbi:hypothetical protein PLACP1_18650 [Planifilum fimeticola]
MSQYNTHSCYKWKHEKQSGHRMAGVGLPDQNQWNVPHGPEQAGEE